MSTTIGGPAGQTTTGQRPPLSNLAGEPVLIISVIEALLSLILSFDTWGLSSKQAALIMACVAAAAGLYQAFATNDQLAAAGIALVKAAIALGAGFDLNLTTNQTTAVIALATIVFGLFHRTQTSPSAGLSLTDAGKSR